MDNVSDWFLELDDLTDWVIGATEDGESDPVALTFLLRRYRATGREDLTATLGTALARAVETSRAARDSETRSHWLEAFVTAAALSSDARMLSAIRALVEALRAEWRQTANVADLVTSIDACLQATLVVDSAELVRDAIDELERVVAGAYHPGQGLASTVGASDSPRQLAVQIRGASALVTACVGTARLPYGMLAEELIQFARREFWDGAEGMFVGRRGGQPASVEIAEFADNCAAVRVLCRLARLLDDDEYRRGAVVAPDTDYRGDASRILMSQQAAARAARLVLTGTFVAPYALALDEWLSLG